MIEGQTMDGRVAALADRFPALFRDLHRDARTGSRPVACELSATAPIELPMAGVDYLLYWPGGTALEDRVARQPKGRPLIQLFHCPAEFLGFLGEASFPTCVASREWHPWLLVPPLQSEHAAMLLESLRPRDWPWALAQGAVRSGPAVGAAERTAGELFQILENACCELRDRLDQRYEARPTAGAVLRAGERPLRVLCVVGEDTVFQKYSARDVAAGLAANGVTARTLQVTATPAVLHEVMAGIDGFDPDVLLLFSRGRDRMRGLPAGLAVWSWDQDYCVAPAQTYAENRQPSDRLFVMLQDWKQDAQENGIPADRVHHLNMGTDLELYRPPTARTEPECDVLFIGNYFAFERYRAAIRFDEIDEPSQRLLLEARDELRAWIGSRTASEPAVIPDIDELFRGVLARRGLQGDGTPDQWRTNVLYIRYRLANMLLREMYLSALAGFRLRVYGRGWDALPAVAPFAQPAIENGPELCAAIHRAAICIHVHSWTVHHPRLYDTAAAGGFLLVGRVPEDWPLERVFTPGEELDTFGSIPEMLAKVRYYLERPELRRAMGERAAARCRRDHGLDRRMQALLEEIRDHDEVDERAHGTAERLAVAGGDF